MKPPWPRSTKSAHQNIHLYRQCLVHPIHLCFSFVFSCFHKTLTSPMVAGCLGCRWTAFFSLFLSLYIEHTSARPLA